MLEVSDDFRLFQEQLDEVCFQHVTLKQRSHTFLESIEVKLDFSFKWKALAVRDEGYESVGQMLVGDRQ